ncbi:unnamed protein product [Cochlearia groenlandica]
MPNERSNRDGDRLSPAVGSATDRASDPKPAVMPTAPPSAPESSSQPGGQVRKDSPPKRMKVSAKSVLEPIGTKKTTKISKEKKPKMVKPIHFFTSSKSKLSGSLGKIRTLSESGEPLELVVPEPNQRPWNCPPGYICLTDDSYLPANSSVHSKFDYGDCGGRRDGG